MCKYCIYFRMNNPMRCLFLLFSLELYISCHSHFSAHLECDNISFVINNNNSNNIYKSSNSRNIFSNLFSIDSINFASMKMNNIFCVWYYFSNVHNLSTSTHEHTYTQIRTWHGSLKIDENRKANRGKRKFE